MLIVIFLHLRPKLKSSSSYIQYTYSVIANVSVVNCISVALLHSSKALSSYRQIRRKYREQVWRLEQKVAAMTESQHQNGAPKSVGEASEWRREETVL